MGNNQIIVALRYLASNATGALTLAVMLGAISPDQSAIILAKIHVMYQATQDFIGAFASIWYIVFPIIAAWLLKMGVNSSGIGAMMDRVFTLAKAGNMDAKAAIVNAAASPEIGSKGVVNPELANNPAVPTTANVVDDPAKLLTRG
jgi:ABC-type Fe3+ transport system substrate-binding protein